MNATPSITANEIALRTTSLIVRPSRYADEYIGQRSQPVDEPLAQVLGDAEPGVDGTEQHGLGEDPGDHELLVVAVAGHGDRAAEHVHEQHHEHDRLQAGEHEQLGVAGERARGGASLRSSCRGAATRPGGRIREDVRADVDGRRCGGHDATATSSVVGLVVLGFEPATGEREEHVVERRVAHADVLDRDAEVVESPHGEGHDALDLLHGDDDALAAVLHVRLTTREVRQALHDPSGVGRRAWRRRRSARHRPVA